MQCLQNNISDRESDTLATGCPVKQLTFSTFCFPENKILGYLTVAYCLPHNFGFVGNNWEMTRKYSEFCKNITFTHDLQSAHLLTDFTAIRGWSVPLTERMQNCAHVR